jgi:hypothetical protein
MFGSIVNLHREAAQPAGMSALPLIADINRRDGNVRFVPKRTFAVQQIYSITSSPVASSVCGTSESSPMGHEQTWR